ncbi:MAG: cyclic nucleotide-binding domain-containing protein [Spirochaetaceae bacterium]|jgi:CRP-like cAMP-binding protein|nr:cyclic nucleotide-binding domain-containing protein [Spirochaetaceae bacterium]
MAANTGAFHRFSRTFLPGEVIFSEFEPGNTFYFIQSGRVELVKLIGDTEKTLNVLQPSEMFGEMALLENFPRSATAIALDVVKVLEFNRKNFDVLMKGTPRIALRLLKLLTKRIYDTKRQLITLTLDDNQAKIADVFLMLNETQAGINKNSDRLVFNMSVDDIAHWAGMSSLLCRDVLNHFILQRRLEVYPDKIVVRNINDFSRFVNARRKKSREQRP